MLYKKIRIIETRSILSKNIIPGSGFVYKHEVYYIRIYVPYLN